MWPWDEDWEDDLPWGIIIHWPTGAINAGTEAKTQRR